MKMKQLRDIQRGHEKLWRVLLWLSWKSRSSQLLSMLSPFLSFFLPSFFVTNHSSLPTFLKTIRSKAATDACLSRPQKRGYGRENREWIATQTNQMHISFQEAENDLFWLRVPLNDTVLTFLILFKLEIRSTLLREG